MKIIECRKIENQTVFDCCEHIMPDGNPEEWRGITVFGDLLPYPERKPAPGVFLLLDHVRKTADRTGDKAQLLLIGEGLTETARDYFAYVDRVFVYDAPGFDEFDPVRLEKILWHFIDNFKPAEVLFLPDEEKKVPFMKTVEKVCVYLNCEESLQAVKIETVPPVPDAAHRGELVICEIPE
ncbi:MAG: hypothetical protein IKP86_09015 [Anaerolineaceae bacterium]|nr:hypothetical protein [Anaerolineaceae bacterium]